MSEVSPMNILNHELIGLETKVVDSRDPTHVSRKGIVVAESKEMIQLETPKGDILLPKDICIFHIQLPNGTTVQVDGNLLLGRPEERLRKRHKRRW